MLLLMLLIKRGCLNDRGMDRNAMYEEKKRRGGRVSGSGSFDLSYPSRIHPFARPLHSLKSKREGTPIWPICSREAELG